MSLNTWARLKDSCRVLGSLIITHDSWRRQRGKCLLPGILEYSQGHWGSLEEPSSVEGFLCYLTIDLQKLNFHFCFYLRGFETEAAVRLCRHMTLSKRLWTTGMWHGQWKVTLLVTYDWSGCSDKALKSEQWEKSAVSSDSAGSLGSTEMEMTVMILYSTSTEQQQVGTIA